MRLIIAGLLTLLCSLSLQAHGLRMHAVIDAESVSVQLAFGIGNPASGVRISVFNDSNILLVSGKSDERGRWSFTKPEAAPIRIVADDEAGHRIEIVLTKAELAPSDEAEVEPVEVNAGAAGPTPLRMGAGIGILLAIAGLAWWWSKRPGRA